MTDVATLEAREKVNILLVDDQPAKLLSYELILQELDETLLKANSAQEALALLLKSDVAVILIDVCMPDLDGFELARMIRDHPRFKDTAIIFVSAIHLSDVDTLKGYDLGGVDYVPVPVMPGVLRGKVRVFVDLYRKTRALARLNDELERRVEERTSELQMAIARQELLAREVDHRARNALSVIQSIVSLTPASDSARYAESIKGRIHAMARAHNLLAESRWRGADLLKIVHEELAPYSQGAAVSIDGEPAAALPNISQNLALALHEMATNAAKYGALSKPDGRLDVKWRRDADDLLLSWTEECAFPVSEPARTGFGFSVIDASVVAQLGGRIERTWGPNGLCYAIAIPRNHFSGARTEEPQSADQVKREAKLARLDGQRILIVDDEPLIAMMTGAVLSQFGAVVVGPFASAQAARAGKAGIDAALLDVNLGGELAYALADELMGEGVPFAFMTGYQPNALPRRYSEIPVLTKPVDAETLNAALVKLISSGHRQESPEDGAIAV